MSALLADLQAKRLLGQTLVVVGTEVGRRSATTTGGGSVSLRLGPRCNALDFTAPGSVRRRKVAELDQARLLRMQLQAELRQAVPQLVQEPDRVRPTLEPTFVCHGLVAAIGSARSQDHHTARAKHEQDGGFGDPGAKVVEGQANVLGLGADEGQAELVDARG